MEENHLDYSRGVTYVELKGEKDSMFFMLYWKDKGAVIGLTLPENKDFIALREKH